MPNTLAHLGAQALVTRGIIRDAEPRWIYLGCLIPDLPWIAQRALRLVPSLDLYDLRLYAIAQSSLAASLLLAGALAAASEAPRRIFAILSLNSILHLVLDALEIKWGNGVHLLAPVSWRLWNQGLFWPESAPIWALTAFGLAYVLWAARLPSPRPVGFALRPARRSLIAGALLLLYVALPIAFLGEVERSDSHFVATLRDREARTGREIELDRARYSVRGETVLLRTFAEEELKLPGVPAQEAGKISVRATFSAPDTLRARELHLHPRGLRDAASLLGLALVAGVWLISLRRNRSPRSPASP